MKTEKDPIETDNKRAYRSPQLTAFGSIAGNTQAQQKGPDNDNSGVPSSMATGILGPMGGS
jgi:hypothetical protein